MIITGRHPIYSFTYLQIPKSDDAHSKTDVFHFPDESQVTTSREEGSHPPCKENVADALSDDEFEILDHPGKEQEVHDLHLAFAVPVLPSPV